MSDILDKRAYVGGLSRGVTEKDLEIRFSTFGVISSVDIIRQSTGECRGFAYVTLKTTDNDWKKCVSLFNGAKWKGMILKIQEAKPDYKQRLKKEWEIQMSQEEKAKLNPPFKKRRRGRSHIEFADDMSLVTDNNAEHREGWKQTKCGRAVSVMRLKKDDGTRITIDPSHYQGNLLKLSDKDIGVKPKPFVQLPSFYEEYEITKEKQQFLRNLNNEMELDENISPDDSGQNDFTSFFTITNQTPIATQKLPPPIINDLKKIKLEKEKNEKNLLKQELSNQIRLEALKQRAQEKRTEKEKITQALRTETVLNKTKHIVFGDNDMQDNAKPDTIKLFDSDESDEDEPAKEYNSMDIVINPLFEGASGRDRLNLQKKFRGDKRFKLTEDFVSEDDEQEDVMNNSPSGKIDEVAKSLEEERTNQFDILKEMFGDDMKPEQSNLKKKEFQWKNMVHFDPDAPEARSLEVQKQEVNNDLIEPSSEFTPLLSQPLPKVSKDVKIEINANLKEIFASRSSNAPFSLFGDYDDAENETQDMQMHDENGSNLINKNVSTIMNKVANQKPQISSEPLFFFHFRDNVLSKRSHFREMKIFMRTSSVEEITSHWKETSRDLTKEYKRKHKSVSRKLNKIKK